ncbi:uncharacterized protein STEHIDRAFT_121891 [Stereum hirsutum FP-91666 SS1]|uniref:uncharacterized protein n=1 Tax=Stereum hirsutum (strain FP-91666) TaxID=721885 RepID=UPI000444925C|nr:uncharacterized protein STEHIDRAFT_121891 [Stereum hirsutum FP-91666 SS1]EIM85892.1 hypothetical protein STEHIDRAFT_121891 [Stereum hirsutum FP-91666 SS1]
MTLPFNSLRAKRDVLWSRIRHSDKTPWVMACTFAVVLAVVLGIPLGWRFRGRELNIELPSSWEGRTLSTEVTLIAADASVGTATFQWYIYGDTCITQAVKAGQDITDTNCPLVNVFLDPNSMTGSSDSNSPASNNRPNQPLFQFNATAFEYDYFSSFAMFRTQMYLASRETTLEASLENYPFDKYVVSPWIFASLNATGETVGIFIGSMNGIAVGFQAHVKNNDYTYSDDTTEVYITVSRSTLVKTYAITVVMTMWLVTLVLLAVMVKGVIMGKGQKVEILVLPITTLFAFTSLRTTMPGAPQSFGVIIDFVGTLPSLVFLALTSLFCLIPFLFDHDPEEPRGHHSKDAAEENQPNGGRNNNARPGFRSRRGDSGQYIPLSFDSYESTVVNQTPGSMSRKNSDYYDPYSRKSSSNIYPPKWTTSRNSLDRILLTRMESPGEVQTAGADAFSDRPVGDHVGTPPSSAPLPGPRKGSQRVFSVASESAPLLTGPRESVASSQFGPVRRDTSDSIFEGGHRGSHPLHEASRDSATYEGVVAVQNASS